MTRQLIVHNPGMLSLIQDTGRTGFQRYGVSVSGAVDGEALRIGNLLVGNDPGEAAIEVAFGGAEFEFTEQSVAAITGADLAPSLDGTSLSMFESFAAPAGSKLRFSAPVSGMRSYLAVDGGIASEPVLGSRSTHVNSGLGGLAGESLKQGDAVPIGESYETAMPGAKFPEELRLQYGRELEIRVIPGGQSAMFSSEGVRTFYSSEYSVSESSDRQGLRLDGPVIESAEGSYDIVSDAVLPGAIQVPGDGKPIILLADSQTTGGYAKIGVIATVDLPLLAQAGPGSVISFVETSVDEAQRLMRARYDEIASADLWRSLESTGAVFSVDGLQQDLELTYRPEEIARQGGALASVKSGGSVSTVRVEELC